jgi:mannonate dehydratase
MEQTMRWFGSSDPVQLSNIMQAGATGIVTALHQIPNGQVWPRETIRERISIIESAGNPEFPLRWSVVESVPVHEDIKKGLPSAKVYIENYKATLINLATEGIETVCYNFMPVLDWSRTDLDYLMPDGSKALHFHYPTFAAFDLFLLKRAGAMEDYSPEVIEEAKVIAAAWTDADKKKLENNILRGLPGAEEHFTLTNFQEVLDGYKHISEQALRQNLFDFVSEIAPLAQQLGIRLSIHPDDPPFPLLGLPRVVSTANDAKALLDAVNVEANGLCFCTGSYGARPDNDLLAMVKQFADRIHFVHLRAVKKDLSQPKSFFEADHLGGDADMVNIIKALVEEEGRRKAMGRSDIKIPMRPDHGHQMLDDLSKTTNPGYSAIGRLRGLAELRGIEAAVKQFI